MDNSLLLPSFQPSEARAGTPLTFCNQSWIPNRAHSLRSTMRTFGITIVFLGVGTTLSIACDCAPSEYIDDKQILLEAVHEADLVIEGNPISFEIVEGAGNEPIAIAKFKVLKCVKGECGSEVTIKTSAGNLGANCGMDFKIEAAFKNKETAWLSAYYFEDKDSQKKTLGMSLCNSFFKTSTKRSSQN